MIATRLEVRVHMITAAASATQNVVTAVNRAGVHVDDTVFEPLACADSVLRSDERELGICLADIGAGSTNVFVIQEGSVGHSAVLPGRRRSFHQRSFGRPMHAHRGSREDQEVIWQRSRHADSRRQRNRSAERRRSCRRAWFRSAWSEKFLSRAPASFSRCCAKIFATLECWKHCAAGMVITGGARAPARNHGCRRLSAAHADTHGVARTVGQDAVNAGRAGVRNCTRHDRVRSPRPQRPRRPGRALEFEAESNVCRTGSVRECY